MGYAAVASLSQTIDLILSYHQDYTSPRLKNQIISLQKHSVSLRSFVEDDPNRAKYWEETIREVTDRAEEIVELLLSDSFLGKSPKLGKAGYEDEPHYDFHELERVTEEMESVVNRVQGRIMSVTNELMEIISRLRGGSSSELQVIGIVGMAGTGKTTLARNAYNHQSIVELFEVRAWATVSNDHGGRQGTILELLYSINNSVDEKEISDSEYELISSIQTILRGRKYLIVLDDVWSSEDFERLKLMFPDDGNGSRIILTTRLYGVASTASTQIHHMLLLDENESWQLFKGEIFRGDPCPAELESVAKMIARSCGGHPLSILVVCGILAAADPTESAWEEIFRSIKIVSEDDDHTRLVKILSASCACLPHHLRPCFLCLAIFPAHHEIYVSKLVKLWVAEGFLNETECKSFEETRQDCVDDLVKRYLVCKSKTKSDGRIKSIAVIHDLVRDVCLRQAEEDDFILHNVVYGYGGPDTEKLRSCRRVSTSTYADDFLEGVYGSTIRTIMLFLDDNQLGSVTWSIVNVRLLRILDLSNAYNIDLPEEVFDLFHLRYLAFHSGFSISEAISNLENLQTLIIFPRENDGDLKCDKLPRGIWRMHQLRHLFMYPFELPSHQGETTSALENLQTLSVVDFICSIENLEMMPNLKKLAIRYTKKKLRDVEEDLELHNLIYLGRLEILKIEMDWSSFGKEHDMSTRCTFPPTLKKLNLCGVQLPWKDMKIVGSLPNLQVLKLRKKACISKTWETNEGEFSKLTYLLIEECNMENWITESDHFPTLKCLVLHCCLRLLEVPEEVAESHSLKVIELDEKNPSLLSSVNRIQEKRKSLGYDRLKIRLV